MTSYSTLLLGGAFIIAAAAPALATEANAIPGPVTQSAVRSTATEANAIPGPVNQSTVRQPATPSAPARTSPARIAPAAAPSFFDIVKMMMGLRIQF